LNEERRLRSLLLFSLPVIVGLFYATAGLHFSYTPDDTYIYLQFARNVGEGHGVSFNAGEPTYGVTSPLWMLVIALGGKLGVDPFFGAKALDLVFASLALVALYLAAFEIIRDVGVSLCAAVAFSVNAWFLRWSGSGMETSLSVLLMLLTLLFCLRNQYLLSAVTAGFLTLVRPEGALFIGLIMIDLLINSLDRKHALRLGVWALAAYALVVTPWLVFAYMTFGRIVPNTALGKAGWDFTAADTLSTAREAIRTLAAGDGAALIACLFGGALLLLRKPAQDGEEPMGAGYLARQSFAGLGWTAGVILFYIASGTNVVSRYLLLVTPLITVYAFAFFAALFSAPSWRRYANVRVILLTSLIMLQNQLLYRRVVLPGIQAFEDGMESCLIPIGEWFRDHSAPGTTVLTGDIGAIGYYSGRRMCDAAGLISPAFLPLIHAGTPPEEIIGQKLYRSRCAPDYVVHRAPTPEALKGDPELVPLFSKPFPNLTLSDSKIIYYTVYRMRGPDSGAGLPGVRR
jgi:hypothetical protein